MDNFTHYITIVIFMILLDTPFLQMTKNHFNHVVGSVQGSDIELNYMSAFVTYLIMAYSFYYFIVKKKATMRDAMVLGFITYGVFDFTNMSIFKGWDLKTSLMDTLWGTLFYGLTYMALQTFTKII